MSLYSFKPIDEIPGSESFIQELVRKYGSDAFQVLNQSGLKLEVGINDSDYKKTVLDWRYKSKSKTDRDVDIFKFLSEPGTAPIKGYVFEHGELRCIGKEKITQYFNVTPTKKIGLEIILEKQK